MRGCGNCLYGPTMNGCKRSNQARTVCYNNSFFKPADLPEAGASAERISSVTRWNAQGKEKINAVFS